MSPGRIIVLAVLALAAVAAIALFDGGNSLRKTVFAQALPAAYFSEYDRIAPALYRVSGPVYAFEKGFTRSLVVRTSEGIAVIDSFNDAHATALKAALEHEFPGEAIRWVILSHNHLDHVRGSELLAGLEIIGHSDVNQLVADWPDAALGVATVTSPITGDQTLQLGDVSIEALYMPFSHSHTLYGFHIPAAGVVYAPDMMFVRMLPPFDFPDFYYPGYIRALDRLLALGAAHYVPSHGDRGTAEDLMAYRTMTAEFQEAVRTRLVARGVESATDGPLMREILGEAYDELEPKYGQWHGFNDMFVPKFGRHMGGTYLGY